MTFAELTGAIILAALTLAASILVMGCMDATRHLTLNPNPQ